MNGVGDVGVDGRIIPDELRTLHRAGVGEVGEASGILARNAPQIRSDAMPSIGRAVVAGRALAETPLAQFDVGGLGEAFFLAWNDLFFAAARRDEKNG